MTDTDTKLVERLRKAMSAVYFPGQDEPYDTISEAADRLTQLERETVETEAGTNRLFAAQNVIMRQVWDILGGEDDTRPGGSNLVQRMTEFKAERDSLAAKLKSAEEALRPFAEAFERRRVFYSRRHQDGALGYAKFDKMPDSWPMEKMDFSMGDFRAVLRALASIQQP